jgi:4-alpha-glucanotransferase
MKNALLKKAFLKSAPDDDFEAFKKKYGWWLDDYSLFMALKKVHDNKCWNEWEEGLRFRKSSALKTCLRDLSDETEYYKWIQFVFFSQWNDIKKYAKKKKVKIIGDMPIYVAYDSADCWANTQYFDLDKDMNPRSVSGCPPDYFAPTGQLWGNPVYNWNKIRHRSYDWWVRRVEFSFEMYDIIRIDHFRGFDEFYSIPAGSETAEFGTWEKGPGLNFFKNIRAAIGDRPFIAEDLGTLTDSVHKLVHDTGYPGMKVLEFAFSANDNSEYLPHHYEKSCVVYTGTHDNNTIRGWYDSVNETDRAYAETYLGAPFTEENVSKELIMLAERSIADTCIIPMQDWLDLGTEARINRPGTVGDNWHWRMKPGAFTDELSGRIKWITGMCSRI